MNTNDYRRCVHIMRFTWKNPIANNTIKLHCLRLWLRIKLWLLALKRCMKIWLTQLNTEIDLTQLNTDKIYHLILVIIYSNGNKRKCQIDHGWVSILKILLLDVFIVHMKCKFIVHIICFFYYLSFLLFVSFKFFHSFILKNHSPLIFYFHLAIKRSIFSIILFSSKRTSAFISICSECIVFSSISTLIWFWWNW